MHIIKEHNTNIVKDICKYCRYFEIIGITNGRCHHPCQQGNVYSCEDTCEHFVLCYSDNSNRVYFDEIRDSLPFIRSS